MQLASQFSFLQVDLASELMWNNRKYTIETENGTVGKVG